MAGCGEAILLKAILLLTCSGAAIGKGFKVGDNFGWTIPSVANGVLNYTAWANSSTYNVGDSLVFTYEGLYHNVLSVTGTAFAVCNTTEPLQEWIDGNTTIVLSKAESLWFICGFPGHCEQGMAFEAQVGAAPGPAAPIPRSIAAPGANAAGNGLLHSSKSAVIVAVSILLGASTSLL